MEQFITRIRTNLNGVLEMTQMFDGLMMTGDNLANRIIVELNRDGTPLLLSPAEWNITGYIIRNDGYTLDIIGDIFSEGSDQGHAYIDLPDLAYEVSGPLSIAVRMNPKNGTQKVVIATASCYVNMTRTDAIIDPTHRIPDIEELLSYIEELDMLEAYLEMEEEGRVLAETARETAESARVNAEAARATADASRDTAESARVSAEAARVTAEQGRVSAESARVTAETGRETAQSQRNYEIDHMTVEIVQQEPYTQPTVVITEVDGHKHIRFGIAPGDPFVIAKTFASVAEMEAYTGTDVRNGQFVVIETGDPEDPDNSKMYLKTAVGWAFVTDLSGAQGIKGEKGDTGNGISSVVLNNDYTLSVYFTDGTSYTTPISIRGAQGETGNGIASAEITNEYKIRITYTDGTVWTSPGSIRGTQGNGIASVVQNADYTLTITLEDGTTYTTDPMKGEKGDPGTGGSTFTYSSLTKGLVVELF